MMKKQLLCILTAALLHTSAGAVLADEELCLDCHEPAEDWEGMSPEEILADASDMDIKRHADNAEFSEEQLRAMIAAMLQK